MRSEQAGVLLLSPFEEDLADLQRMLSEQRWRVFWAQSREEALQAVRQNPVAVVIAERDVPGGSWKDLLEQLEALRNPPFLIVTSRYADNYLWAEVLNLGGWDVLMKPLHQTEVSRVLQLAGDRWRSRAERASA
jgi:DNA-binding response OmpR family regulator